MSGLDLKPKVSEEAKAAVSYLDNLETSSTRIDTRQLSDACETSVLTPTAKAKQAFLDGILQIPDAVAFTHGGQTLAEQAIRVIVPDILGATADAVIALEVRIRRQYCNVRLSVEIEQADTELQSASQTPSTPK